MKRPLRLGISPCPNDTFVFHGLLSRKVEAEGLELEIELADVEELNARLFAGEFDAAKASFHAALALGGSTCVLPVGAALGFGVGPVLLAAAPAAGDARALSAQPPPASARIPDGARVLSPGRWTTAHLLYRLFHPGEGRVEQCVFSDIVPALEAGRADFGLCIHEARFTWRARGLQLVEDLGATWEARTRAPLPLGGILARRALGEDCLARLTRAIRASLDHARAHPERARETMRAHAQEHSDDVLDAHVALYVNDWTRELGPVGRAALDTLRERACAGGVLDPQAARLAVFEERADLSRRTPAR